MALAFACGDSKTKQNEKKDLETKASAQLEGMKKIDLGEYQLSATISIPDDSKGKTEVVATDWGSIEIKVSDWFGIEVVPFGMSIIDKKTELKADLVYSIEYLTDEESLLFYKRTISGSEVDPEYHFFMTKEIDGDLVEVKSSGNQSFTKRQVEKMILSAKTLSPKAEV